MSEQKEVKKSLKAKIREKVLEDIKVSPLQDDKVLEVRNLHVSFAQTKKKNIHIVRGVDLDVKRGEIVGLVGESGSGKSVTSKTLINVNENGIITADKIQIGDYELTKIKKK
ncbi:ATP-binding cassette domain-containing protein [Mycoplasma struthionis]|uniref:ATP-binding cassette domain-containing protein n=1 Tax=Mycoplasma struthionis TaxID=538220 RepID=UPI002FDFF16B